MLSSHTLIKFLISSKLGEGWVTLSNLILFSVVGIVLVDFNLSSDSWQNQINISRKYYDYESNKYEIKPWDNKDLQDFSSLGINPDNLSFSVNRNLKQEKDQEVLLDDISFESINIKDQINYIPKIFDVSNQNQKIILRK